MSEAPGLPTWEDVAAAMRSKNRWSEQVDAVYALFEAAVPRIRGEGWDERERAKPQYFGPDQGHYEECCGYEDCYCASYPNPYRPDRCPTCGRSGWDGVNLKRKSRVRCPTCGVRR